MHGEFRLDRIVGRTILPCALTKNFALAQRANDPPPLFSLLALLPSKAIEAKGISHGRQSHQRNCRSLADRSFPSCGPPAEQGSDKRILGNGFG